jgi:hypothetical protein
LASAAWYKSQIHTLTRVHLLLCALKLLQDDSSDDSEESSSDEDEDMEDSEQQQQQQVVLQLTPAEDGQLRVTLHVAQTAATVPATAAVAGIEQGLCNGDAMEEDSSSGDSDDSSSSSSSSSEEESEDAVSEGGEPMDYAEMREMIDKVYK